jgi:hypothetical protein
MTLPPEKSEVRSQKLELEPSPTTSQIENQESKIENPATPEFTLQLSFSLLTLLVAPLTVLLTLLLGWLLLTTLAIPLHTREMLAAALLNVLAGIAACLPLALAIKRGTIAIARAGLIAIALRMGLVLLALLAALAPAWHLDHTPLIAWVIAFYFPLLIAETALVAWLVNKTKT